MKSSLVVPQRRRTTATAVLTFALCLFGSLAIACNVPVYRYALDHWHPDLYRAVLFHSGALSADEQQALESLQASSANGSVNLSIRTIDVASSLEESDKELLSAASSDEELRLAELPRLVVQYPKHLAIEEPIWSRQWKLDETTHRISVGEELLDSPARKEILRRLVSGQTAVWLLVESGTAQKDDAATKTLERELKKLPQMLELPTLTDAPEDAIHGGPELRIDFSLLRVQREDAAEQALLAMLLNCEPDLLTIEEPVVFPIFGRSRVLLPLVGGGITPDNIRNSSAFLVGACSCQVKELNPGFDLLNTADWSKLISWPVSPTPGDVDVGVAATAQPTLLKIPSGAGSRGDQAGPTAGVSDHGTAGSTSTSTEASNAASAALTSHAATQAPSQPPQLQANKVGWRNLFASMNRLNIALMLAIGIVVLIGILTMVFRSQRLPADL